MFDPNENPLAAEAPGRSAADGPSAPTAPLEPLVALPPQPSFPAWSAWDVLAVLVFTAVAVFGFSLAALFIARAVPAYRTYTGRRAGYQRARGDRSPGDRLPARAFVHVCSGALPHPRALRESDPLELAGNFRAGIFRSGDHSGGGYRWLVALPADSKVAAYGQVLQ